MKNILFLHSSSDFYGSSKVLMQSVDAAIESGNTPFVVLSDDGPLVKYFRDKSIKVEIIRLAILRRKYFTLLGGLNRLYFLIRGVFLLYNFVIKNKIDIIYSNTTGVLIGCFLNFFVRKYHVFHIHEIIENPKVLVKIIATLVNLSSNNVIIISKAVADNWITNGVDPNKIQIIYNGQNNTDLNSFKPSFDLKSNYGIDKSSMVIGMVGRINNWKGQKYFFDIARKLIDKSDRKLHFVYAGDVYPGYEYLYKELEDYISYLKIDKHVTYIGYQSDISSVLSNYDIFVLPSITPEPFGMVVIEAMDMKLPIVVTNHGGPTEIIENNKSGVFIPFDNAEVASNEILKLINDETLRSNLSINAKKRVIEVFSDNKYKLDVSSIFNYK